MRAPLILAVIVLALSQAGRPAQAQTPAVSSPATPQEDPAPLDDVVVTGGQLEALAQEFVDSLAAPARRRGLARWDGEVCVGVVNFRAEVAHLIIDRISDVARELAIELGEPGCEPNLVIVGTTDAPGLAQDMVRKYRSRFFRFGYTSSNRGSAALEVFQASEAPVRWWHVSLPIVVKTGQAAIRLPGEGPTSHSCRTRSGGWVRNCDEVTDRIMRMITIVDIDEFEGVDLARLADYLTMIGLAQIEPDADYSAFPTVLNLFDPAASVAGLSDWDMIYLRALYSEEAEHLTAGEQAERMLPALRDAGAAD